MDDPRPEPGGDEGALLALALRFLAREDPFAPAASEPRLLVGRLPEDLPIEIPMPEGAVVVGSVSRKGHDDGEARTVEIALDTTSPARAIRDAYRELLATRGWTEPMPREDYLAGFEPDVSPDAIPMLFCRGPQGPALFVTAHERPGAPTEVRLRLVIDARRSPCEPPPFGPEPRGTVVPFLAQPPGVRALFLTPPFGARLLPGTEEAGLGLDHEYSAVFLETNLDLPGTSEHYATQLEEAGWVRSGEGRDDPQAWSTWTFADDEGRPWDGLFVALRLPRTPRRYFLQLHASRTT